MSDWSLSIPEEIYDNYDKEVALPAFYERAVAAVKECESIPDSNEWKGKADAIIAYAQTVDDERLEKYAKRIKMRAYRRMGELLKQYDGRGGDRRSNNIKKDSGVTFDSAKEIADQSGISERQRKTAVGLAKIPEAEFDAKVESDNPPTIKSLTRKGSDKFHEWVASEKPPGYSKAIWVTGRIRDLAKDMKENDALFILEGLGDGSFVYDHQREAEIKEIKANIAIIESWFDQFLINL